MPTSPTSRLQPVPIEYGSHRFHQRVVGPYQITVVRLDPHSRIDPHYHERPNVGVMLDGGFDLTFSGRPRGACDAGTLFVEPAGETHCNCVGCQGAWVLAIQPDPLELPALLPASHFLEVPSQARAGPLRLLAGRLARELHSSDCFSALLIEGLAAELLAIAGRTQGVGHRSTGLPPWLDRVERLVEAGSPDRLTLQDLAREAGVHVTWLTRWFRTRFGKSPGRYLLERRLEWAARELADSRRSIAEIACLAGFADQSHFTRRFRDYAGQTPARYRAERRA